METLIVRMKDNINLEGQTATLKAYITTDHIFHYTGTGAVSIQVMDTVSLTVNNKLDVWANGGSTVYYKGDVVINTQELTGGSQIIKVN